MFKAGHNPSSLVVWLLLVGLLCSWTVLQADASNHGGRKAARRVTTKTVVRTTTSIHTFTSNKSTVTSTVATVTVLAGALPASTTLIPAPAAPTTTSTKFTGTVTTRYVTVVKSKTVTRVATSLVTQTVTSTPPSTSTAAPTAPAPPVTTGTTLTSTPSFAPPPPLSSSTAPVSSTSVMPITTNNAKPFTSFSQLTSQSGMFWGAHLDTSAQTSAQYNTALGMNTAVFNVFILMNAAAFTSPNLAAHIADIKSQHAIVMLTVEPTQGLDNITSTDIQGLASLCKSITSDGSLLLVRFAHEMNGDWYIWGSKPVPYVAMFRQVSQAIKAVSSNTAMVWAPNNGLGYPFRTSGALSTSSPYFAQLDTNKDGVYDSKDDPFAPFWPGQAYVDWIGVSLYNKRNTQLSTSLANDNSDRTAFTTFMNTSPYNLYTQYAKALNLPFMLAETAGTYYPDYPADSGEVAIKQNWWTQIWSDSVQTSYPLLRLMLWFEFRKADSLGAIQEYRITNSSAVLQAWKAGVASANGKVKFLSSN